MEDEILRRKLAGIKLLACDFDGVMTDGRVYVDQDGRETVRCSRRDGMGITMLQNAGVEVVVISREANPVVTKRCEKIGVKCWSAVETTLGKLGILQAHAAESGLTVDQIAYVGDDVNDIAALNYAGVAFSVADGHRAVQSIADYVTKASGGNHVVREICELIFEAKGITPEY